MKQAAQLKRFFRWAGARYACLFSRHRTAWLSLLWVAYAAFTLCCVWHHEPWRDELQAWLIARELDIPGIFYQMRYEGHFALWSLMLKVFTSAGAGLVWMGLLSWALMLFAAWLLLFRSPFYGWVKFLLLLSFPMLYYFPVVARCYALIPPILFLSAICYERLSSGRGHYAYCLLLGLLAHTHAYMEGMVGMLFALYVFDYVILPWRGRSARERWKSLLPPLLTVLFVVGAFLQVLPALTADVGATHRYFTLDNTWDHISGTIQSGKSPFMETLTNVLFLLLLTAFVIRYRKGYNPRIPLLLLGAIGWQIYFSTSLYGMNLQRPYLIMYVLVFAFWILRSEDRIPQLALGLIALFSTYRLPQAVADLSQPYTNVKEMAAWLEQHLPPGERIAVDNMGKVISAYAPGFNYFSVSTGKPVPLYAPHDLDKRMALEQWCDTTSGKPLYFVTGGIQIKQFTSRFKGLDSLYQLKQVLPRPKEPAALAEVFYLFRLTALPKGQSARKDSIR